MKYKLLRFPLVGIAILAALAFAQRPRTLDVEYRDAAGRLIGAALVDNGGWQKLSHLTTRIGNRLSGSASLERAVQWVFERMKAEGLENTRLQPVKVGAHDDGGGIVAAWQAVVLMKQLGLRPRRTVRVVAWTNEENGTRGAQAYLASLGADVRKHVAAIEMDDGVERPLGFRLELNDATPENPRFVAAQTRLAEIAKLLSGIGADTITPGDGGADITPLMRQGVPALGLLTAGQHYFDWHHTNADTLDKVNVEDFRRAVATLAVMAYVLADMPGTLLN